MRNTKSKRANRGTRHARRASRGSDAVRRYHKRLLLEPLETRVLLSVTPQLIDLNPSGASSPSDFVQVGDFAFFAAEDGTYGRELWKTDGTPEGTTGVKDIRAGSDSSDPSELVEFNGELFFVADDGVNGQELWKSDGTAAGTALVRDIATGTHTGDYGTYPNSSNPENLVDVDGTLFFAAHDGTNGRELWKSDGTAAGTALVRDIATGTYAGNSGTYPKSSHPGTLVDVDGALFFAADDGVNGRELWKSDGTAAGTVLVRDIVPGTYTDSYGTYPYTSDPDRLTAVDGTLFFVADDGTNGTELWKSDGTEAGTVLVKDINPGSASGLTADSPLAAVDGVLLFAADDGVHGDELWKSDGTDAGTGLVKDIEPGSEGNLSHYAGFTEFDGTLLFSANNGASGRELWRSDGTEAGTVLVKDIHSGVDSYGSPRNSYPFYMKAVDGTLYFSAFTETEGRELWQTDGTAQGTALVADTAWGTHGLYPNSLETVDGMLVFAGDDGSGRELWTLDLEAEDTGDPARLTVYVDGVETVIPANVGVYSDGSTADVFTTDDSGVILVKPAVSATLGEFFDTWRTDAGLAGNNPDAVLSAEQLLGNFMDTTSTIQMLVDGEVSREFDDYVIQDGDEIVLVYGSNPVVSLNTNFGPIVIELFEGQTPGTVDNFLNYVSDGDYINSFFHRSDPGFVIQGGGFATTSIQFTNTDQFSAIPTDSPIANESELSNVRGTVAMARTSALDSATSQFFVNLSDNLMLDPSSAAAHDGYAVFGQVLDMTTVDRVESLPVDSTNASPYGELPVSTSGQLVVVQALEGQGELTGVKFLDDNANGVRDAGELGVVGLAVFLDGNDNGAWDAGELATTTDDDGRFLIQVEPGTYTVRAEVSPGRVSTVPVSPDSYTVSVQIGRETGGLDFGERVLSPPSGIDLLAASDSGVASDDNLTNRNNATAATALQFLVSGVVDGADVRLFSLGIQIGIGTASGGTVTITTDGVTVLDEGLNGITATQALEGGTSDMSDPLDVTVDTTPPGAILNTAPVLAEINQPYAFDAFSPDEGQPGVTYSLVDEPAGMTINQNTGVVTWTPSIDQAVPQLFEIVVSDAAGNTASQTVDMTVLGVIPAYPDGYPATEDSPLVIDEASGVLANDGDEQSGVLSDAVVVDQPANGDVTLNPDGSFTYTPEGDFFGTDSFTYMASDGQDDTNVAKVTINVLGVNDPPTAAADAYTLAEDVDLTVDADSGVLHNDTDPDRDTLTAYLDTEPANGTLSLGEDGSFSYEPNLDFSGTDSFTYYVSDDVVYSDIVTVTLTVTEVPDPPTAVADSYSVDEDGELTIPADGVLDNDDDPDSDVITASLSESPANGTVELDPDGSFTYTPNPDFFGTDGFTYTASDGVNTSPETSVTITVNSQPDPPTATDDSYTAPNDATAQTFYVLTNDTSDPDPSQGLAIESVTQGTSGGTVTIGSGVVIYTAPLGFLGTDEFTYTIRDDDGLTATATVTVSVVDASDNSLSGFVYLDAEGDGARDAGETGVPGVLITLTGTDNLGAAITRTAMTLDDGSYEFIELPAGTYVLTERQPEAMSDGLDSTTVPGAVVADDQFSNLVLSGGATFAENNFGEGALRVKLVSIRLFLASTPPPEQCLRELVARAEELAGNTELAEAIRASATDYDNENQAPAAVVDTYTVDENSTLNPSAATGVLHNDVDPEGDALTATRVGEPSHGSVTLSGDGSFNYTPNTDFSGTDSFTYQASDDLLTSNTATVTITVHGVNDAPIAVGDPYSVDEDVVLTIDATIGVLANDSDADGDSLTALLNSLPANGTVDFSDDGSFTYTPDPNFNGTDSFTYMANDGSLNSSSATVTITVNPIADVPVAVSDSYSVDENATLSVDAASGVLHNDSDADGGSLTALQISWPANGTLSLSDDYGSFTYTPDPGFTGTDTFTYQAFDGFFSSQIVTVTITVNPFNAAPVVEADAYSVPVDGELTVDAASGVLDNDSDADDTLLIALLEDLPANGEVLFYVDGSFTYTPDPGFHGTDTFTYKADDGRKNSAVTTVTIDVNSPAEAVDDAYSVAEDGELTVDAASGVLDNDSDGDGDPLVASLVGVPDHGILTLDSSGSFIYIPEAGFHGTDSFTYTAGDGFADSAEATVTVSVSELVDQALAEEEDWLA